MGSEGEAERTNGKIRELTREEARALFDRQAQRLLNMTGDEFIRAWDAGSLDADAERPEVAQLALLIPLGR